VESAPAAPRRPGARSPGTPRSPGRAARARCCRPSTSRWC